MVPNEIINKVFSYVETHPVAKIIKDNKTIVLKDIPNITIDEIYSNLEDADDLNDIIILEMPNFFTIPQILEIPRYNINIEYDFGTFKWSLPSYLNEDNSVNIDEIYDMANLSLEMRSIYLPIESIYDWCCVYSEKSFCDCDGACIFYNANPKSKNYGRFLCYESFDEPVHTLLKSSVTLDLLLDEAKTFEPDEESSSCNENYFVSFIAEKYPFVANRYDTMVLTYYDTELDPQKLN